RAPLAHTHACETRHTPRASHSAARDGSGVPNRHLPRHTQPSFFKREVSLMTKNRFLACCAVVFLLAGAIGLAAASGPGKSAADTGSSGGSDTANLDKTCKPCDDFYQFAMGGWMKNNPIPAEYSSWGTFTQLADKNQQNLRTILEAAQLAKAAAG